MSCEKDFNIFEFLICSFKFRVTVWRLSSLGRYHHPFCLESRKTTKRPWDNLYFHFCIYILNIRDSQLDTRLCYCYCIFAIFIPFFLKCTSFHFYPTNNHDRNDFCYWHFFGVVHLHLLPPTVTIHYHRYYRYSSFVSFYTCFKIEVNSIYIFTPFSHFYYYF